jgi:site-specific recombinase
MDSQKSVTLFQKIKAVFSPTVNELVLNDLLCQRVSDEDLFTRLQWIEHISSWLFQGDAAQIEVRFKFLFQVLQKNPEWKLHFQTVVNRTLVETRFLGFFSNVGFAVEHGLWSDIAKRILNKMVPSVAKEDFQEVLFNVVDSEDEIEALHAISDETILKMKTLLTEAGDEPWPHLRQEAKEALIFLVTHIAHYGISSEMIRFSVKETISKSSFVQLTVAARSEDFNSVLNQIMACEKEIESIYEHMEENGVSVDVVNRLETVSAMLTRVRSLVQIVLNPDASVQPKDIRNFISQVARAGIQGRSIWRYISRHFYLLSKKIVERNGHSGDHYIARTRPEFVTLFKSAIGGGIIVVFMTIFKTWLIHLAPPPLFLAFGIWVIYSIGFLGMQFTGATLATKIPSFTASKLATQLKNMRRDGRDDFREEFRLTLRSQAMALIGNIVGLIPVAILMNYAFRFIFNGYALMDEEYARHIMHDVNPVFSFSVLLGALTGVQLWLSSIAGGWFENWIVFHQVPTAIANHYRLKKLFGEKSAQRFGNWVQKNASGIATNVSLGFLFGYVPILGTLLGLNWNGNHVTISSTGFTFAAASLNFQLSAADWIYSIIGILLIAAMNFGVSFCLALFVAGNAERMRFGRLLYLLRKSI